MCGIVGYVGSKNAPAVLIEGLKKLEYRGYDSSGIAYINNNKTKVIKEKGTINNLEKKLVENKGNVGIGHTRWATHGIPNKINSHPHKVENITIVHNGIIENYLELKKDLINKGYELKSDTDTEVACALICELYKTSNDMKTTLSEFKKIARGAYAIGVLIDNVDDKIYAIKNKSPLIIGLSKDGNFIASDVPAILEYTNKYILMEDNDIAVIMQNKAELYRNGSLINEEVKTFDKELEKIDKNGYEHFMLKEINEQPDVIRRTIESFDDEELPSLDSYQKIDIVACGSAYHAGLIGEHLLSETYKGIITTHIASEYRYKEFNKNFKTLVIVVSQSGETADTLEVVKKAKESNIDTLGIINVYKSSIAREVKYLIYTKAGFEISVATTKAYLSQVVTFALLAKNTLSKESIVKKINETLDKEDECLNIAKKIINHENLFFIGRGIDHYIGLEGSLKLKEISYIHSEAYPAGELKHGTISLVKKGTPFIATITDSRLSEKTISNIKEVKARDAQVILIAREDIEVNKDYYDYLITVPKTENNVQSILAIILLQLISYHTAKLRGCDIDKPRNLAKSVTVE